MLRNPTKKRCVFLNCKIQIGIIILIALTAGLAGCSRVGGADDFRGEVVNVVDLADDLVGGGLLSEKAVRIAKQKGFKTVIDLRTPPEGTFAEKVMVEKRGIRYVNIPVTDSSLGADQANQLKAVLSENGARPAIVHCSSGNRVEALWALYQQLENRT